MGARDSGRAAWGMVEPLPGDVRSDPGRGWRGLPGGKSVAGSGEWEGRRSTEPLPHLEKS